MVVVVAVIGIGMGDALLLMRIEVVDHIFRESNRAFYVSAKCP
jgi:hypothetical protein